MSIFLIKSHLQEPREGEEPRKTRLSLESAKDESPFSQNVKRSLQESRGIDLLFSSVCILPQKSFSWSCALRSCTPASSSMSPTSAKAAKKAFTGIHGLHLGRSHLLFLPKGQWCYRPETRQTQNLLRRTEDLESRPWPHPSQWSCGRCCSASCHSRTQTSAVSENEPKADSVNPKGFIVC